MKPSKGLRRRRKGEDALLTKKCDDAWRELVKLRTPYCEVCASGVPTSVTGGGRLEAHHIIPKGSCYALRHELRNGCTLCFRHHQAWVHHGNPSYNAEWQAWLDLHRPEDWAYVERHQHDDGKLTVPQKRDLLAALEAQLFYARES